MNDPRLGALARRDARSAATAIADALSAADAHDVRRAHELLAVIDGISELGERLLAERLEAQLRSLIGTLTTTSGARLDALTSRMGLDGPRLTLRAAGREAGLTGARVQQLQAKLAAELRRRKGRFFVPAVDAAVDVLRQNAPIRLEEAARLLVREGVTRGRLDVAVFISEWLSLLGKSGLELAAHAGSDWVLRPELGDVEEQLADAGFFSAEVERAVADEASRMCRSVGVGCLRWVAEEVGLDATRETNRGVRRIIKDSGTYKFLDRTWFWDPSVPVGRNRLENTLRKLLAVSESVRVDEIEEALDRLYRQGRLPFKPPGSAVAHFTEAHPSFEHRDGVVTATKPIDASSELGNTERILVEVLSSVPGGVLDRDALRRACLERGMNAATFGQYTSFSPILTQPGRNLWALRGREVDDVAVQRLSARPRRRRRHAEAEVLDDSRVLVSWAVTGAEVSVFAVPAAVRGGLVGRSYAAMTRASAPVGTIRVDDGGVSWGYGPFLREKNVAAGDRVSAVFDKHARTVTLDVQRGADRAWVGDLGNCFLHADGWAVRLYVDDALLGGESWTLPLALADATGVERGRRELRWRRKPDYSLVFFRQDGGCTGSALTRLLNEIEARRGDRVFVEVHSEWFDIWKTAQPNPLADPIDELLASAGLAPTNPRDCWRRLSRALGGPSDGARDDVEARLRQRRDAVALGLLQRARETPQPVAQEWPPTWYLVGRLVDDEQAYAVENGHGRSRRVVAVAAPGVATPVGTFADARGLLWVDGEPSDPVLSGLRGHDGVSVVIGEITWTKWARGEHQARRASASGSAWRISYDGGVWRTDEREFGDLSDALASLTVSDPLDEVQLPHAGVASYPTNAYAFRMVVSALVRDGLCAIAAHPTGFRADFADGSARIGLSLVELRG